MSLEQDLREYFGMRPRRVVIVGIGNPIRGDDAVGPRIIELLESRPIEDVLFLNTESVPEAFTGKVEKFNPTHVLLVDAANFHGAAGETKLINGEQIGGQAVSTHSLPLNIFISYIEKSLDLSVLLLGIQPLSIGLGAPISEIVEATAVSIADTLYKILSE
jgi:hydrogenase 3 maturation protease